MIFNLEDEKYQRNPETLLDDVIKISLSIPSKKYIEVKPELQSDYSQEYTMKLVNYDKKNAVFTYPAYDERLEEHYNQAIFSDEVERDLLPMRGYFNYLSFQTKELLFGILLHKFRYDHVNLKESDERFFNHDRQWEKKEAIMWDFETEEFVDVPYDINEKHKNSQNYIERRKLINQVLSRFEKIGLTYQQQLIDFIKLEKPDVVTVQYKEYFKGYKDFLEQNLPIGLKLNFVYSNISLDEYLEILKKATVLREYCANCLEKLENYPDGFRLTEKPEMFEIFKKIVAQTEAFRTPRTYPNTIELKPKEYLNGYLRFSYEKMTLFPNIVEVERRRSRKSKASSLDNEVFIQKRYLNYLKSIGLQESKQKTEQLNISIEELDKIFTYPKNLWNKEIVKLADKYEWSIDDLIKEIQKVHDYAANINGEK